MLFTGQTGLLSRNRFASYWDQNIFFFAVWARFLSTAIARYNLGYLYSTLSHYICLKESMDTIKWNLATHLAFVFGP